MTWPVRRGPDAATLLIRALYRDSCRAGCPVEIVESDWVRWASATFCGARHTMTWRAPSTPALEAWLTAIADREFHLRGHLVADIVVAAVTRMAGSVTIQVEALTLQD